MKKLIFFSAALALLVACGTSATKDNDPWAKIDPNEAAKQSAVLELSMQSTYMKQSMSYSVWLPAEYDNTKTYPFFYLLHGMKDYTEDEGQLHKNWLNKGNAAKIADDYQKAGGEPMVIVMPNGLSSFYVGDYEEYFQKELMVKVEADFHGNGKRAIAGLSMGGYGTLYHALKYPEKFTYAYAMSPAVDVSMVQMVTDPSVLPGITIETGEDDITTRLTSITPFVDNMKKKGVEIEFITRSGGHEWPFWKVCLPKALRKAGASFK